MRSATTMCRSLPCCSQLCTLWHCTHTSNQAPFHCKYRSRAVCTQRCRLCFHNHQLHYSPTCTTRSTYDGFGAAVTRCTHTHAVRRLFGVRALQLLWGIGSSGGRV
jgi:hypothetical protein